MMGVCYTIYLTQTQEKAMSTLTLTTALNALDVATQNVVSRRDARAIKMQFLTQLGETVDSPNSMSPEAYAAAFVRFFVDTYNGNDEIQQRVAKGTCEEAHGALAYALMEMLSNEGVSFEILDRLDSYGLMLCALNKGLEREQISQDIQRSYSGRIDLSLEAMTIWQASQA
jgi:hypothetical protein